MIILIWLLNFGLSWLNAWGCGKSWTETKHLGGWPHFMNWMGAIMSACGFTWCYMVIAVLCGGTFTHEVDGKDIPYLSPDQVQATIQLGYMMIIFPILGSGLAITIHSWIEFWRRKTLANGAIAGYNTFANMYNLYNAFSYVPESSKGLSKFFGASDEKGKGLVLLLAIGAVCGGVLTTYSIITSTARSTAFNRRMKYANAADG